MVAFHSQAVPLPPRPTDPRDWSHTPDGLQPPLPGQPCFVVMLIGVRKKARWRPRTLDAMPPVAHMLGAGVFTWTRSRAAAIEDVASFNRSQLQRLLLDPKERVTLWGCIGWGVCGFGGTVRIVEIGGEA